MNRARDLRQWTSSNIENRRHCFFQISMIESARRKCQWFYRVIVYLHQIREYVFAQSSHGSDSRIRALSILLYFSAITSDAQSRMWKRDRSSTRYFFVVRNSNLQFFFRFVVHSNTESCFSSDLKLTRTRITCFLFWFDFSIFAWSHRNDWISCIFALSHRNDLENHYRRDFRIWQARIARDRLFQQVVLIAEFHCRNDDRWRCYAHRACCDFDDIMIKSLYFVSSVDFHTNDLIVLQNKCFSKTRFVLNSLCEILLNFFSMKSRDQIYWSFLVLVICITSRISSTFLDVTRCLYSDSFCCICTLSEKTKKFSCFYVCTFWEKTSLLHEVNDFWVEVKRTKCLMKSFFKYVQVNSRYLLVIFR